MTGTLACSASSVRVSCLLARICDRVDVAREDLGRVGYGLAASDLQVRVIERQRLAAQLTHGNVERHARAGRRLLEDQDQHRVRNALWTQLGRHALAGLLHGPRHVENAPQGAGLDAIDVEKMPGCSGTALHGNNR